jgi:hypothetical protein
MKKILKTTGTIGAAAALSLSAAACDKTPPAANVPPSGTTPAGSAEAQPSTTAGSAEAQASATAQATSSAQAPDCKGKDQFTEACGYASPSRYAALDPAGIRNG